MFSFLFVQGKTVITLALILMNPAPAEPVSGTRVSDIFGGLKEPWDKEAKHDSSSTGSSKRGSILSRGTLVIVSEPDFSFYERLELVTNFSAFVSSALCLWSGNGSKKPSRNWQILALCTPIMGRVERAMRMFSQRTRSLSLHIKQLHLMPCSMPKVRGKTIALLWNKCDGGGLSAMKAIP